MIVVGNCQCGAAVLATYPEAAAVQRSCFGHPLQIVSVYLPYEKPKDKQPSDMGRVPNAADV